MISQRRGRQLLTTLLLLLPLLVVLPLMEVLLLVGLLLVLLLPVLLMFEMPLSVLFSCQLFGMWLGFHPLTTP
jgi:hypothetical protein